MHRLFVAIELPRAVRDQLRVLCRGLPDTRWMNPDQFHLTVRFIGEVGNDELSEIKEVLRTVHAPTFELMLMGAGQMPPRGRPTSVFTGADGGEGLDNVHHLVTRALAQVSIAPDSRRYMPHITLGRLQTATSSKKLVGYMSQYSSFQVPPFKVNAFCLFSSTLTQHGAKHRLLEHYPLSDEAD